MVGFSCTKKGKKHSWLSVSHMLSWLWCETTLFISSFTKYFLALQIGRSPILFYISQMLYLESGLPNSSAYLIFLFDAIFNIFLYLS